MSLINEMLKDLEARGGSASAEVPVRAPAGRPASRQPALIVALAALVIALAAVVAYLLWPVDPASPAVPPTTRPPVAEPAVAARTSAPTTSPVATAPADKKDEAWGVSENPGEPTADPGNDGLATIAVNEAGPGHAANVRAPATSSAPAAVSEPEAPVIVRRHEPTPADRAARATQDGFAALRRGDWPAAARLLQELVALEPANDRAREGLVVALTRQGRIAEADGVLLDGLAQGTEPARFAKMRARLQAARGELQGALASLAVATPPVARDPEYHALKGALAQQAGDFALAAETYRALVNVSPANGTWQAGLGMALDGLGEYAAAVDAYRRALAAGDLDPALVQHIRQRLAAADTE